MQLFAQGEFQPPPLNDMYRETVRRYNTRMPYPNPLSPSHRVLRGNQASLPHHFYPSKRLSSSNDLLSRNSRAFTVHTTQMEIPGSENDPRLDYPVQVRPTSLINVLRSVYIFFITNSFFYVFLFLIK